jgi:DNA modification methylase
MSNKMVNGKKAPADSANQRHDEIKNDAMSDEEFYNFISDILKEIKINCLGAYYICFGSQTLNQLLQPLLDLGIEYKSIIIWMKNQAIFSGKDFKSRYEPIVYGRFNDFFNGARFNEEDIWEFARTQKNDLHPTMKPIPLIENALNYSSKEGMNILDLFLGSGSTMVASHQLKRKCYGMELDCKYVEVIVQRMINLDKTLVIKRNGIEETKKWLDKLG